MSDKTIKRIVVNGGDVFDGSPDQFRDSFFDNVSEETVRGWASVHNYTVEFFHAPDYKTTVRLPQTAFPMMPPKPAERLAAERRTLARWDAENLYDRIRVARRGAKKFVLHDGPPYANGDIHMGHALNKVIKDIIVRFKTAVGFDADFIPGWDCHGLPIEQEVAKKREGTTAGPIDTRNACKVWADEYVDRQREQFKDLAVLADWERPYLTTNHQYEAEVLRVLARLLKAGLVYREKKPVHWCVTHKTALAEAELEYRDRDGGSAYVLLKLRSADDLVPQKPVSVVGEAFDLLLKHTFGQCPSWTDNGVVPPLESEGERSPDLGKNLACATLAVWTTTPWTLPANYCVAVNPSAEYVRVDHSGGKQTIIARPLVHQVMRDCDITDYTIHDGWFWTGYELAQRFCYEHPVSGELRQFVADSMAKTDAGTGAVHIAPAHGYEDFQLVRVHFFDKAIHCPVREDGTYDDTLPPFMELSGKSIRDGHNIVISHLARGGMLLGTKVVNHSVPHCWRCKNRTITRATEQWFVRADKSSDMNLEARDKAADVEYVPDWGRSRLFGTLQDRPDWCISRQRTWGIPIPAFKDPATGRVILTDRATECVARFLERNGGSNRWWDATPKDLLLGATMLDGVPVETLVKTYDILDVWFESGASQSAVLEPYGLTYPADLYVEGSDQHRGWFQASLLLSHGKTHAPFKTLLTHGFLVDKFGRKMGKTEGNDIKVSDAVGQYGIDVIRLWVASVEYTSDVTCDHELFKNTTEMYRKLRNTIRYLLGNLYDFRWGEKDIRPDTIHHYISWRCLRVREEVWSAYERYDFKTALKAIYDFANMAVSGFYAKAVKDPLYCGTPEARAECQVTCYYLTVRILEMLAPIAPVMCDEAWQELRNVPTNARLAENVAEHQWLPIVQLPYTGEWLKLIDLIPGAIYKLDEMKKSQGLNNTLDARVVLKVPPNTPIMWPLYAAEIENVLGVGDNVMMYSDTLSLEIEDRRDDGERCERCWKRRAHVGANVNYSTLCLSCVASLAEWHKMPEGCFAK
jgi:isoleucyl-tRNA synthetase